LRKECTLIARNDSLWTKKGGQDEKVDTHGEWRVVDVAIDDESWVSTINEKVSKTLKEKGWNGLKDLLNKRLKELKSGKKIAKKED
jgi:hypothetical protein